MARAQTIPRLTREPGGTQRDLHHTTRQALAMQALMRLPLVRVGGWSGAKNEIDWPCNEIDGPFMPVPAQ